MGRPVTSRTHRTALRPHGVMREWEQSIWRGARWLDRNRVVVLFVAGLLAADWLIGRMAATWEAHSPDDYAARVNACRARPRDVVFVGGSPVAEAIDPAQIVGVRWAGMPLIDGYALGLSGGTTSDFYHAVRRACPTPPRVLVYGITATDINDSRNEPHGPYVLMHWGDLVRWVRLRPDAAEWGTRHFLQGRLANASHLFHHRHGIRMWAATEADRLLPGSCPETMREANELREHADDLRNGSGYAPLKGYSHSRLDLIKLLGLSPPSFPYLQKFRTGSHLRYLHKLVDWCESNHVTLVLVDMPVSADLETAYPAEFAEYRTRLAEVELGRGLTVIRASREATRLTDAEFADQIHLTPTGARVFSQWLRTELERKGQAVAAGEP